MMQDLYQDTSNRRSKLSIRPNQTCSDLRFTLTDPSNKDGYQDESAIWDWSIRSNREGWWYLEVCPLAG